MVASQFEYRHRFWMMLLVYVGAYSLYNVNPLNILYAVVPWSQGDHQRDMIVRFLYAAAALVAAAGAALLTWATAYRPPNTATNRTTFSTAGPFRYVRDPHYWAYLLLLLALGTFQSVLGFPAMLVGETILLLRLIGREELQLEQEYGQRFRNYAQRVPRLLPSFRSGMSSEGNVQSAQWRVAVWDQAFQWGFVATLLAFAFTLSDPVGYAFAAATIVFFLLQKLSQFLWLRLRRA
jgi:protein-S-isoprenylcysteine O-methyltransferase Ste14